MPFLALWHVYKNPPKEQVFKLEKTVIDYEQHLRRAFRDKVLYFVYEEIEE